MNNEEIKQKVSVIISATNTTGSEKRVKIMELFTALSQPPVIDTKELREKFETFCMERYPESACNPFIKKDVFDWFVENFTPYLSNSKDKDIDRYVCSECGHIPDDAELKLNKTNQ